MSVESTPAIDLQGVSFAYDDHTVVRDINLTIDQGDYIGMIGPNGGGKTTLLKIMLGLLKPAAGEVKLFGQPINQFKSWEKIGYISQRAAYGENNFPATVREIVSMGRYSRKGLFRSLDETDEKKISEALDQVEMAGFQNRLLSDLSGGQQQRVLIARALVGEPQIIFLDEPTVGIDVQAQEDFYALLQKLNHQLHITLVLVSHDIDVITNEVTEIVCVNQSVIYHGSTQDFVKADYVSQVYGKNIKFILHGH